LIHFLLSSSHTHPLPSPDEADLAVMAGPLAWPYRSALVGAVVAGAAVADILDVAVVVLGADVMFDRAADVTDEVDALVADETGAAVLLLETVAEIVVQDEDNAEDERLWEIPDG